MSGTTPPGASGEQAAAAWVRAMFARVAPRYDLLNHLLSLNRDRVWRRRTVRPLRDILRRPRARILDLCCGTGDLLLALESERGRGVLGSDFCHGMLVQAQGKIRKRHSQSVVFESDALALPLRNSSLDLITLAFGFRNLVNYQQGLAEMRRVLRPSGALAILEFSQPQSRPLAALYDLYSRRVLPFIGGLISGDRSAYQYLPESVRKFPAPEQLAAEMRQAGFSSVQFERLSGGIVALHLGAIAAP
jgi:demethylmenaquinone methyltransferase/2-methoxy-6-polyprenyl-1,4-benzoquinol methylase